MEDNNIFRIKKMRFTCLSAAVLAFTSLTNASSFLPDLQILAEINLDLAYNETLACGGCIRAGYTFCASKDDSKKGRNPLDYCCNANNNTCLMN